MMSAAKLAANRQNALKSTGPRSPQGKARSSTNALTHGLTARHCVADGESVEAFEELRRSVLADMSPKNEVERQKVDRLIELYWKLQRGRLFETAVLSNFPEVEQIEQEGVLFDTNVRFGMLTDTSTRRTFRYRKGTSSS
jgi:hypothetical protein